MTIFEKIMEIAEKLSRIDIQKVYDAGFAKGYEEGSKENNPFEINLNRTISSFHLTGDDFLAGQFIENDDQLGWYSDGYNVHYYESTQPITGGQIKITGALQNSFYSEAYKCVILVCDGVVAVNQTEIDINPYWSGVDYWEYTITIPEGVNVNGIYLNCSSYSNAPELSLIK